MQIYNIFLFHQVKLKFYKPNLKIKQTEGLKTANLSVNPEKTETIFLRHLSRLLCKFAGMLTKIKHFFFYLFLRLKTKKETARLPLPLNDAKTIGILFYAGDVSKNDLLMAFIQQLKSQQKDVQLLGYMPKRELGFVFPFPFITEKDTNWYGKPGGGTSGYFTRSAFDLLINFHPEECLPLEYIAAVSSAKFRVGFNKEPENANYDLILIPKENKDISNLIQNLENYLK